MRFAVFCWLVSRALVLAVILSAGDMGALAHWDGAWYGSIATNGYHFADDGKQHNVAFFPLLPLLAWPLLKAGLAWPLAAALIVNVAFLGALLLLFAVARRIYDEETARWSVALASLLPVSLFSSVDYPQSLYLLASLAALYFYGSQRILAAGWCTAVATTASGLGIPLAGAFFIEAMVKRSALTFIAAVVGSLGIGAFVLFCALRFADPLAFVHAQAAWRHGIGFDQHAWVSIVRSLTSADGFRQNVQMLLVPVGAIAVIVESRRLGSLMTSYALLALGVLLLSGTPFSVDRNAYAVAPVLIAIGALLRRAPIAGYVVLAVSVVVLLVDASRFAHFAWVA